MFFQPGSFSSLRRGEWSRSALQGVQLRGRTLGIIGLGKIGMAEYQTPGTPANGKAVGEVGVDHQVVLMQNHGVITWGDSVEDAHWKMENIDAYCRTVWIASQLGSGLHSFGTGKMKELLSESF